jgi:hypothetical protein
MKGDGCGRSRYEGENLAVQVGIFRFGREDKVRRVWMV